MVVGLAQTTYGQSQIAGYWMAGEGETIIEFTEIEEGVYQGKIVWIKKLADKKGQSPKDKNNPDKSLRSRDILGLPMVERAEYEEGAWVGEIYSVKNGRTVNAKFSLLGEDTLVVKVGFRGFKRTQEWTRTELPK